MKKETRGRKPLPIMDSLPYGSIIFLIASGVNYPEAISKARNTDSSSTVKQLETLKKEKFLNEPKKEKLLNKTVYSLNWDKVIGEFLKLIKEQKDEFVEMQGKLKVNVQPEKLQRLNLLDDKKFIDSMKNNKYLLEALKQYFSTIARIKQCPLSQALGYFVFFGNFDFIYSTHPSIYGFLSQEETIKQMKESEEEDKVFPQNKEEWKAFRDLHKSTMDKLQKHQNTIENKIKELKEKDKDFNNMLLFNEIRSLLGFDLGLQIALNDATELTAFSVIKNNFKESELKDYQNNLFFPYSRRYKGVPQEEIDKVKEKISEIDKKRIEELKELSKSKKAITQENDFNATKPTENNKDKSGNTHRNIALSSEDEQGENLK